MSLRVTGVSTVVVGARLRNWVFVRIETDQPGLIGWGEASLEWHTRGVVGAVDDLVPLIVGEDPRRTEHLWQSMVRHPFFGGGVVGMSAISGIDQALWDIKAKDLGVPLHELLGGPVRDHVRMYDHLGGAALSGGRGSVLGALLGVLIIGTLSNGMILLGVPSFYQLVAKGGLLIFAVVMSERRFSLRRSGK